ncbi:MAG: ATP-binding protein [Kiritimatiellae bacterium]|nr:ATP-binding protein [Kiritimatiellia bacterium]
MDFYRITKIRLVNFHNFTDETIELRSGGHLFMLGDNGSGKTTVLDAVHFVLTGGRSMEFNSAARVAGARHSGGRSVQGIVMRYNIEANGPLNPNGGVTYAALEIAGRNGRPVTAAVGVSTTSMDERYESWGVLREGPVEELPLLKNEGARARVTTKTELKAALGGSGYYGQIGAYTDELATRFFADRETFDDVCKFLATGKAYREIAAHTSDYHQLFRQLLQEPPREVFEEVVTHLKSLEESRQDLDKLRDKHRFVEELAGLCTQVLNARVDAAACQWQERHLAARECQRAYDLHLERLNAEERRLADLQEDQKRLEIHVESTARRLEDLRRQDAQGLVAKEQEARLALAEAKRQHELAKRKLIESRQRHEDAAGGVARARDALRKQTLAFGRALQKLGRAVPFSTAPLAAALDDAPKSETPETELADLPLNELRTAADDTAQTLDRQLQETELRLESLEKRLASLTADIDEKRARGDTVPLVKGFAQAQSEIRQRMSRAQPLYLGLEPASGVSPRELAALEQIIGDATLATWITDAAGAADLRSLLFRDFPEQSLAVVDDDTEPLPAAYAEWLRRYFDLKKSDPSAILALQHQLAAKHGPHTGKFLDLHILHFRLREQPLTDAPPRLLGEEMRRRELERELRELEKKRLAAEKERKESAAARDDLDGRRAAVTRFKALLNEIGKDLARQRDAVALCVNRLALAGNDHANARAECQYHEELRQQAAARHEDILVSMKKSGLEGLEERIREVERKWQKACAEQKSSILESGRVEQTVRGIKALCEQSMAQLAAMRSERDTAQERLLALVLPDGPLDEFVRGRCGGGADSRDTLTARAAAAAQAAAVTAETIRNRVVLSEGLAFGFVYDETQNLLADRRGRTVADVLEGATAELREQEDLISEQTIKLFRQLVMDNLVSKLQTSVLRLNEMSRRIGRLLKERAFGSNRYAFSITPLENCRRIYDLVTRYRSLDPEKTESDLRAFIEDHAEEIKNTEIGEIPPILDYRNWFRYELKVLTAGADGIVMDRKVKSIGSGGEQAVPNYLLILTIAHFLYDKEKIRLPVLIFDEAFYGIDAGRRDQLLGFASDLELQLFVASPDQDGVKKEIPYSTSMLVVKDAEYHVHLYPYHWSAAPRQTDMLDTARNEPGPAAFGQEL